MEVPFSIHRVANLFGNEPFNMALMSASDGFIACYRTGRVRGSLGYAHLDSEFKVKPETVGAICLNRNEDPRLLTDITLEKHDALLLTNYWNPGVIKNRLE